MKFDYRVYSQSILERSLLAAVVAAGVGSGFYALNTGLPLELTVFAVTVTSLLLCMFAERLFPYDPLWNHSHGDLRTDILSAVILLGIVDPLIKYTAPIVALMLYAWLGFPSVYAHSLGTLPFAVQLLIVTLGIEFGRYWAHRLHHQFLWSLHALHHSSERLYAFNNFRFHPLNYLVNFLASVFPFMLLGTPVEVLMLYLAITQPVLMLQHANLNLRSGWLNYLFSTNELHRWHHSSVAAEANNNYGNALVVWDQLFGTFKYHAKGNMPNELGLFSSSKSWATKSYFSQIFPFTSRQCCKA